MARARTGEKQWRVREKTWKGRVRGDDGKRGPWLDLCTDDEKVAQKRLEHWVRTGEAPSQAGKETFSSAAERILREQEGRAATAERRHRIRAFALPVIGHIEIAKLKAAHVHSVLAGMDKQRQSIAERAAKLGAARVAGELGLIEATVARWVRELEQGEVRKFAVDTVHHMRVDISRILGALVLEDAIAINVAKGVELPDDVEYDDRPFVVLNDDEVARLFKRGFDDDLMMACLLSREFGAQRTSDLLASDWEDYDLQNWTALVRRPKTDDQGSAKYRKRRKRRVTLMYERVRLVIPESVRGPLAAWRERQRDPVTGQLPRKGPLFPAQRGKNAGKRKASRGNSWAQRLRDALWQERIVRPLPGWETAEGEERRQFCALQVDTEHTRRAVFHSFRRASVTALRKAGVPLHVAMLITGHSEFSTHMGYNSTEDAIAIPEASLATHRGTATADHRPVQSSKGAGETAASEGAPAPADPSEFGLGREPHSTPPADLGGVRPSPEAARGLEGVLAALLDVIRSGGATLGIDPRRGSNAGLGPLIDPRISQGFQRRAQKDSNLRPSAPEAGSPLVHADNDTDEAHPEAPSTSATEHVLTHDAGQSSPERSPLEALLAAAHAALQGGDWELLRSLQPLIDAARKREAARAPVVLEEVRARRGAK